MNHFLDFWNLMAYDFCKPAPINPCSYRLICVAAGSWDTIANHQANLHHGPLSGSAAVKFYISRGVPCDKIVLGIPVYGRSFLNTKGLGHSYSGLGQGTWEAGVYDYRTLPLPGSNVHIDAKAVASWSYDPVKHEMISFDSEDVVRMKGEYIRKQNLGGSMFWELSADKGSSREGMEGGPGKDPQPGQSLVTIVKDAMGGLEQGHNWLEYDESKFDNMKNGML
jgi:chitinase